MDDQRPMTVTLSKQSNPVTVTLLQQPGRALAHFVTAKKKWVSWSELYDVGVFDPDHAVRELERLGASFQRMYKDMVTSKWTIHEDAPHYKYLGWHMDANTPANILQPKGSRTSMENEVKNISNVNNKLGVEAPSAGQLHQRIAKRKQGVAHAQ